VAVDFRICRHPPDMNHSLPLTDYQRDTIRAAVEIFNELPICPNHNVRHIGPHMADYEWLILVDASAIMEEWSIEPTIIPGTTRIEVAGVTST
jgi:hypothetical protein